MLDNYAKIAETSEAFVLNLDDYSGLDDFECSKGLLWDFKYYLSSHEVSISTLLDLEKMYFDKLIVKDIVNDDFILTVKQIVKKLMESASLSKI